MSWKQLRRYSVVAFSAATVLAALGATQVHAQYAIFRVEEIPWKDCLIWAGIEWYAWALLVPFVAVFASYFRFEPRSRIPIDAMAHLIAAPVFAVAHASIQAWGIMRFASNTFGAVDNFREGVQRLLVSELHWELMSYAMVVAATQFGMYFRRAQNERLARQELETHAVSAQLGALKRQMQPHFLFNALNAQVAMLVEDSPAQRFTIRLAEMLRMILSSSEQTTATLQEEIGLVNAYLEVERARFGDRLRASVQISPELESLELPSLILQPLVENAVTHGIGRATDGGDIVVRASCAGVNATIEVVNTCAGAASAPPSRDGQKIAQSNSRRRLTLMYGQSARLEAGFMNGGRAYRAAIVVPCPAGAVEKDDDASENPDR